MTELYKVFVDKRYPEGWDPAYKKRAHDSLGLFLAQYLCNGFNLADAGRLTYNRTYFAAVSSFITTLHSVESWMSLES